MSDDSATNSIRCVFFPQTHLKKRNCKMSQSLNSQPHAGRCPQPHLQTKYQMRNAATAKRTRSPTKTPTRTPVFFFDVFSLLLRKSIRSRWWPFRPCCRKQERKQTQKTHTHTCLSLRRVNVYFTLNKSTAGS